MTSTTTIFLFLFSGILCHAQRINTPNGYEYHDRHFSIVVDTVDRHIEFVNYFRGKHWITIKSGAYAVVRSRVWFGKAYSWYFEGSPQAISIEIKGKHTDLKYRVR